MNEQRPDKPRNGKRPRGAKTRRSRIWLWPLGTVVVIIVLLVLLVPVILSSGSFTRWVQARISRSTGGQAHIGDLSVGWLRGVRIADFSFRGENNWTEVDIDRIIAQPSYSRLLSGNLALNRAIINQPRVAIDMRERPPTQGTPFDVSQIERLGDVAVRDGSVRLTDTAGNTAQLADLNSDLHIRPRGQTSAFQASMAVAAAQAGAGPGRVQVRGQATPGKKTGWTLQGTTGNITVEVNDLNLSSVAPFLELAGLQMQARGQVSGNVTGALQDGQLENLDARIVGRDVDITGEALKGDRLQTSRLDVTAKLAQSGEVINVSQLDLQTDWARVDAAGTLPKTPESLNTLLESGQAYAVKGQFDVNLAAVLSQMPRTFGVRPGTQITGGRATGNIDTTTENGRAVLVAKADITGLAGVTDSQQVKLSGPVQTALRLSTGPQGAQLDSLNVTAPFARLTASGSFKQINYQGQADLASLQSNLGPFINLGQYNLAGQITSQGQVSLGDKIMGLAGTLSGQKLVLAAPDGNSVAEPQLTAKFQMGLNRPEQVLDINNLTANASFGTISIQDGVVPMVQTSKTPLRLVLQARDVNLNRLEPYAALVGSPLPVTLQGIAQSQITVTGQGGTYHLVSSATRIQDFRLISPEKETFAQPQVTATFDVYLNTADKTINVAQLQVESPQIKITKTSYRQTTQGNVATRQGTLDAQFDWAAVGPLVSAFVPGQLSVAGQRQMSLNFASTYPVNQPNGFPAHLNGQASLGFDKADYLGFDIGPTQIDVRVENGLLGIQPISTTVNNGKLNLTGTADLRQRPIVLKTSAPLHLVQDVQINAQTTDQLLKYVNPIFANVVNINGIGNLDVEAMAIPLTSNVKNTAELTGTLWINQLALSESGLLNQILSVIGGSVRGQILTVHPTKFVLQKGVVRYDDMQIDVGDNPINFRGAIGLNKALDMTVVLPYTIEGRTVRVGQPETGERIAVPLTGTLDKPELNLQKFLQLQLQGQLQKGLEKGLEELFKKR
jgi:hypothetical protein